MWRSDAMTLVTPVVSLATHTLLLAATQIINNGVSLLFVIPSFPSNWTKSYSVGPWASLKIGSVLNPVVFQNIYLTFITEPSAVSQADSSRLSSSGLSPPPPGSRVSRHQTPSSVALTSAVAPTLTPTKWAITMYKSLSYPLSYTPTSPMKSHLHRPEANTC